MSTLTLNPDRLSYQRIETFVPGGNDSQLAAAANFLNVVIPPSSEEKKSSYGNKNSNSLNIYSEMNYQQDYSLLENKLDAIICYRLSKENLILIDTFRKKYLLEKKQLLQAAQTQIENNLCGTQQNQEPSNDPILGMRFHTEQTVSSCKNTTNSQPLLPSIKTIVDSQNGDSYTGQVNSKGERHGKGILYSKNGEIYFGDFKEGFKDGQGVFISGKEERYEGEFKRNLFNGHGRLDYINGDSFVGQFVDGCRHGEGDMLYYDLCRMFKGTYQYDKREGYGEFRSLSGAIIHKGTYHEDLLLVMTSPQQISMKSLNSTKSKSFNYRKTTQEDFGLPVPISPSVMDTNMEQVQQFRFLEGSQSSNNSNCFCQLVPKCIRQLFT